MPSEREAPSWVLSEKQKLELNERKNKGTLNRSKDNKELEL